MSTFDNNSLKQVTLKYTTTNQCSTSKTFKSNDYLTTPSIHNDTNSDKLINTKYEVYIPLIEYEWEDYSRKYWEGYLNIHHTRSKNQKLKQHVQKSNKIFF